MVEEVEDAAREPVDVAGEAAAHEADVAALGGEF
jgi:hypothetical protein